MTDEENKKDAEYLKSYMRGEPIRVPQSLYDKLSPAHQAICLVVKPILK